MTTGNTRSNVRTKFTLKNVKIDKLKIGKVHRIWETAVYEQNGCYKGQWQMPTHDWHLYLTVNSTPLQSVWSWLTQPVFCVTKEQKPDVTLPLHEVCATFIQAMRSHDELVTKLPRMDHESLTDVIIGIDNAYRSAEGENHLDYITGGMCFKLHTYWRMSASDADSLCHSTRQMYLSILQINNM